jgi:hypothetical protein
MAESLPDASQPVTCSLVRYIYIAGNLTSMGIDPGQLFEAQLPALTA